MTLIAVSLSKRFKTRRPQLFPSEYSSYTSLFSSQNALLQSNKITFSGSCVSVFSSQLARYLFNIVSSIVFFLYDISEFELSSASINAVSRLSSNAIPRRKKKR